MSRTALVAGGVLDPVIDLYFGFDDVHPDGTPMREWVREHLWAQWDAQRKVWTCIRAPRTFVADLATAGFDLLSPDDLPPAVDGLTTPMMIPADEPGMLAVYPRLASVDDLRPVAGDGAQWQHQQRRLLVPDTQLAALRGTGLVDLTGNYQPIDRSAAANPLLFDGTLDGLRGVPVTDLDAVNPSLAVGLAEMSIYTIYDLLHTIPRRYLDRTNPLPVTDIPVGRDATFIGTIREIKVPAMARKGQGVTVLTVIDDADGKTRVSCRWFNAPWISRRFSKGQKVLVSGRMDEYVFPENNYRLLQINNPLVDAITGDDAADADARVIGVYPASKDVTTWQMRRAVKEAVGRLSPVADPLPESVSSLHGMMSRDAAIRAAHTPASLEEAEAARTRMAYDEVLRWQLVLASRRWDDRQAGGLSHQFSNRVAGQVDIPFSLTGAQDTALSQIRTDLADTRPMMRLLQGDVGSGKTMVCMLAVADVVESGHQSAVVSPTAVLAQQHYDDLVEMMSDVTKPDGSPIRVELLTNKVTGKRKKAVLAGLADGSVDAVIGTSALFSKDVDFASLGLVVIDEQHRFGVEQRGELARRSAQSGQHPDMLVMTATPAPRTAVLTLFGDLDVSVLDEKPPGRSDITTSITEVGALDSVNSPVWADVREQVRNGRQAFVVAPLVKGSDKRESEGAEALATKLSDTLLPGLRVGLVHGKQTPGDRSVAMQRFAEGEYDVLVSTTVIEVGVNVPNATIMVITGAENFGIAQMHQIRGRVGRGQHPGTCYLVPSKELSEVNAARLGALVESNDGFVLAQRDLEIRGPGSLAGVKQSGRKADLRVADLTTDLDLIATSAADARSLVMADPGLRRHPVLRNEVVQAVGDEGINSLTTQ